MSSLSKYRYVFLVGLQNNLVYRWNFAVRGFFSLFHLSVVYLLWGAAFAGAAAIGGFSFGQTIFAYDPSNPGATAYRNLAVEVIKRFGLK